MVPNDNNRSVPEIIYKRWAGVEVAKLQKLKELFDADTERFSAVKLSDDDLGDAFGYWLWYPVFAEQVGDNARNQEPERRAAYFALVSVHTKATEALMKAAETNGIDSQPIWESADLCRRLLSEPDGRYHARYLSALKRCGDATVVDPWPDCLEGCTTEIPREHTDTARRGLATLTRLSIVGNIKANTPAILKPINPNDARDKWIYEQCCKGTKYTTIVRQLAGKAKWEPIESNQGIKDAANRYAKRNGKPPIPSRQGGRPSKN